MQMLANQEKIGWHCEKCTFWNKFDASYCEVCITSKGNAVIMEKPKEKENNNNDKQNKNQPPKSFIMYLYNGKKIIK